MATWRPSWCSCAPRQPPARGSDVDARSVEDGGLPAELRQLARAGDGHGAGGLAAPRAEVLPAGVEAALRAPGDLHHARVLATLAGGQAVAHAGCSPVMVGGFDQQ